MSWNIVSYGQEVHMIKGYATPETCSELIELTKQSQTRTWLSELNSAKVVEFNHPKAQKFIDLFVKDMSWFAPHQFKDTVELVREQTNFMVWPVGSQKDPHDDHDNEHVWYSFILYFNNDYRGGELYFNNLDLTIKPEIGDVVVFRSYAPNMTHEIKLVEDNPRYTLAVWLQSETPYTSKETN